MEVEVAGQRSFTLTFLDAESFRHALIAGEPIAVGHGEYAVLTPGLNTMLIRAAMHVSREQSFYDNAVAAGNQYFYDCQAYKEEGFN